MQVTLGGDRIGSGNKNKIALKNYERSTHNLSQKITTSMQCGVLYPFSVIPVTRGDSFTIDMDADARTVPTKGPLFGSFKMQIDYFQYPWRLAQAILHNNPLAIGLKMQQVKLPIVIPTAKYSSEVKINNTCLLKYLGLSGYGRHTGTPSYLSRKIMAIPMLAYYEIFKTYYANKQEENAYVISGKTDNSTHIENVTMYHNGTYHQEEIQFYTDGAQHLTEMMIYDISKEDGGKDVNNSIITFMNDEDVIESWSIRFINETSQTLFKEDAFAISYDDEYEKTIITFSTLKSAGTLYKTMQYLFNVEDYDISDLTGFIMNNSWDTNATFEKLKLTPFKLSNIDDMRLAILSKHDLGVPFKMALSSVDANADWTQNSGSDNTGLPYSANFMLDSGNHNLNTYPLNGLVVKTYQSDLFNNWVRTDWIDGENGIAAITAINTSDGSFTIDTLNLSEKLYNMLNRVAVSDGSYEGWQDAVYTESPRRHIESPVYLGGASNEIVFEEIVQTSQSTDGNPLGTLGGKGKLIKRKGGHIHVKVDEASFIIGIVSLTPRINYTQGNEFYLTDIFSMDDLHKPALDGIGFQNLIGERMAWWDTTVNSNGDATNRRTIGKVPAWINYMTRVDKGYGDFAETEGNGFMLLQRNYEEGVNHTIKDATTYIDPQKYNYAFAYTGLDAQNFWVQIYENVKARRLMSAKQIPNI